MYPGKDTYNSDMQHINQPESRLQNQEIIVIYYGFI